MKLVGNRLGLISQIFQLMDMDSIKAIASFFHVVKPHLVYSIRVMLPSAKKDSVPTTQKRCVVYEYTCRCEARYVGRTTQRLADIIK